jgi:hemerythrin
MALVQWSEDYSVGVGNLDRHHQKLFDILNRLHNAMTQGKGKDAVIGTIKEMMEYAQYHFEEEEKLMERIKYPGLNEQRNAHKKFVAKVEEYQKLADMGLEAFLSSGVSTFLSDWLKKHIGVVDKKYQKNMNENGIR